MHEYKRNYFIFIFILFVSTYFILPKEVKADTSSFSGYSEMKMELGDYQNGIYFSALENPYVSIYVPGNYGLIPGANYSAGSNSYYFVKWFDLILHANENFQVGKTYALTFNYEYGSYITWTDLYSNGLLQPNRNLTECDINGVNDLSTCSINWSPQNNGTSSQMVILYRPNITSSDVSFVVGNKQPNNQFVFYNRLGDPQGVRISSIQVTSTQNSGNNSSQDFSAVLEEQKKTTKAIEDLHDDIMSDDITAGEHSASDFFEDFQHDSHGLSGIITSPIRLLNSLTASTCNPLTFQLPIIHNQVTLPCMKPIYENYFGVFFSLYQMITTGIISYTVLINFYHKIHNLQNPKNDRIEVLNL